MFYDMQKTSYRIDMTKTNKKFFIIIIVFTILTMALLALPMKPFNDAAYASSGDYTISKWQMKEAKEYYNARTGCTYVLTVVENETSPITKISYSAYQISINQEDISVDSEGKITEPFAKGKNNNDLNSIEIVLSEGNYGVYNNQKDRTITFEITAYEWSAYQFKVEWINGEDTFEEVGDFLYCTNIDNAFPYIELISNVPTYQQNGYYYEFRVSNQFGTDRSANSGFSNISVYRKIDDMVEPELLAEYTKFPSPLVFYGDLLAIKGEYYIEATDNVGNTSSGVVTNIKYDITDIITIDAIERILENREDYRESLIRNLEQKYIAWQILATNNEVSQSVIDDAKTEAMEAQRECFEAKRNFETNLINSEFFNGEIVVGNLNEQSFVDIVRGETITMNVAFALFDTTKTNKANVLDTAQLPNAKTVYAIDIKLFSNLKDISKEKFVTPTTITIPMNKYSKAAAVSIVDNGNGKTYTKLKVDQGEKWVTIYIESTSSVINLVIDEGAPEKSNLKLLYLLFLIIPLSGIVLAIIYRKRIIVFVKTIISQKHLAEQPIATNSENIKSKVKDNKKKGNKKKR